VHDTYCDFQDLFSEYSSISNQFFNDIVDLADTYDKGTSNMALRHRMSEASYKIIEEIKDDILFQHPQYLFNNLLNWKYRKLDYKLDLKNKKNLTLIENNLKVLHENMNSKQKNMYLNELINRAPKVYKLYSDNSEKINEGILKLEKAMIEYKNYDFDRTLTEFYLEFKGLLNLLLYIKEISTTYTCEFDEDFDNLTLSEVLYKIASIMIVNEGVLKLSKY